MALYLDMIKSELPASGTLVQFAGNGALEIKIRSVFRGWNTRVADLFAEGADDMVDICNMPIYGNASLDFFICSHVLEHVSDDAQAARELFRTLKPAGRGIALVPIHLDLVTTREGAPVTGWIDPSSEEAKERWRQFGQHDHVRLHSHFDFVSKFRAAGFTVECLTIKDFGRDRFRQCGIGPTSTLYVLSK